MTACAAGCGDCCDPVYIDLGTWAKAVADARRYTAEDFGDEQRDQWADRVFIASALTPAGAWNGQVILRCRFFDAEHRACTAYASRPPMCRNFPWYGREPSVAALALPSRCSYLADLPSHDRPEGSRPLIPLTVLRG